MVEIEEECKFETRADQVELKTQTNGDMITIRHIKLTQEQATSLAWLVNADGTAILEFTVKIKET